MGSKVVYMKAYRYQAWDGTQDPLGILPDDLLDAISEDLLYYGDPLQAIKRLYNKGIPKLGIQGKDDLLKKLREQRRAFLERYNLWNLVEELKKRLEGIVDRERSTVSQRLAELSRQADSSSASKNVLGRKLDYLAKLPQDLGSQVKELSSYEFVDSQAEEDFQNLLAELRSRMLGPMFQQLRDMLSNMTPEQMQFMRQMMADLNRMLEQRLSGVEPDFNEFKQKYGSLFPQEIDSLDSFLDMLEQEMAKMQSLLNSLSPSERAELNRLVDALMEDEQLRWEMGKFSSMMYRLRPNLLQPSSYHLFGAEPLDLEKALEVMGELQNIDKAMQSLERTNMPSREEIAQLEQYLGPEAARSLGALNQVVELLEKQGYLRKAGNRYELTPKAIRRLGEKALQEIFSSIDTEKFGYHETKQSDIGMGVAEGTRPYTFGAPFAIDMKETLFNSLAREGPGVPLHLSPDDFMIVESWKHSSTSTALLLDMSRSMFLRGCFSAGKRVAMALQALISSKFPRDKLYLVGFANYGFELSFSTLVSLSPDGMVYGTNMQHALEVARKLLSKATGTRQIILITDGEPTAHIEGGRVLFSYPPMYRTIQETLKEVVLCTKENILINCFMLDRSPELVAFIDKVVQLNHGRAFYTSPERLGQYVLVDYLRHRRKVLR